MTSTCSHDLVALDLDDYVICGVCGEPWFWTEEEEAAIQERADEMWAWIQAQDDE